MILNNRYKQYLYTIFSSVETPFEVWAYGSRVDGSAHEGSDLDLVVRTPNLQKMPIDTIMTLKEKIRESNIPIIVELFDWARLPKSFQTNIEVLHELLYSNTKLTANEPDTEYGQNPDLS